VKVSLLNIYIDICGVESQDMKKGIFNEGTDDKMTKEQYVRANTRALIVTCLTLIFMIISKVFEIGRSGVSTQIGIELGVAVLGGIMIGIGYIREKTSRKGAVLLMGGVSVVYFIIMVLDTNTYYFALGLPILLSSIIYLDQLKTAPKKKENLTALPSKYRGNTPEIRNLGVYEQAMERSVVNG